MTTLTNTAKTKRAARQVTVTNVEPSRKEPQAPPVASSNDVWQTTTGQAVCLSKESAGTLRLHEVLIKYRSDVVPVASALAVDVTGPQTADQLLAALPSLRVAQALVRASADAVLPALLHVEALALSPGLRALARDILGATKQETQPPDPPPITLDLVRDLPPVALPPLGTDDLVDVPAEFFFDPFANPEVLEASDAAFARFAAEREDAGASLSDVLTPLDDDDSLASSLNKKMVLFLLRLATETPEGVNGWDEVAEFLGALSSLLDIYAPELYDDVDVMRALLSGMIVAQDFDLLDSEMGCKGETLELKDVPAFRRAVALSVEGPRVQHTADREVTVADLFPATVLAPIPEWLSLSGLQALAVASPFTFGTGTFDADTTESLLQRADPKVWSISTSSADYFSGKKYLRGLAKDFPGGKLDAAWVVFMIDFAMAVVERESPRGELEDFLSELVKLINVHRPSLFDDPSVMDAFVRLSALLGDPSGSSDCIVNPGSQAVPLFAHKPFRAAFARARDGFFDPRGKSPSSGAALVTPDQAGATQRASELLERAVGSTKRGTAQRLANVGELLSAASITHVRLRDLMMEAANARAYGDLSPIHLQQKDQVSMEPLIRQLGDWAGQDTLMLLGLFVRMAPEHVPSDVNSAALPASLTQGARQAAIERACFLGSADPQTLQALFDDVDAGDAGVYLDLLRARIDATLALGAEDVAARVADAVALRDTDKNGTALFLLSFLKLVATAPIDDAAKRAAFVAVRDLNIEAEVVRVALSEASLPLVELFLADEIAALPGQGNTPAATVELMRKHAAFIPPALVAHVVLKSLASTRAVGQRP